MHPRSPRTSHVQQTLRHSSRLGDPIGSEKRKRRPTGCRLQNQSYPTHARRQAMSIPMGQYHSAGARNAL